MKLRNDFAETRLSSVKTHICLGFALCRYSTGAALAGY